MTDETFLTTLLWISLAFAVVLIFTSTLALSRNMTDLEYQVEAGINGVRRIQSWMGIRTHLNRVLLGTTFVVITVLLLADAPQWIRTLVNRVLFAVLMVSYSYASIADWFDARRQVRLEIAEAAEAKREGRILAQVAEEDRTAALRADRDIHKSLAAEAIASMVIVANRYRAEQGHDETPPLAAVVPEHQSPVSAEQQAEADRQTLRAQLTAATLDLDLPTRTASQPEEVAVPPSVDVATISPAAAQSIADAMTPPRAP